MTFLKGFIKRRKRITKEGFFMESLSVSQKKPSAYFLRILFKRSFLETTPANPTNLQLPTLPNKIYPMMNSFFTI
jgi:hypothetical protein